jgi:hypothetical protein
MTVQATRAAVWTRRNIFERAFSRPIPGRTEHRGSLRSGPGGGLIRSTSGNATPLPGAAPVNAPMSAVGLDSRA